MVTLANLRHSKRHRSKSIQNFNSIPIPVLIGVPVLDYEHNELKYKGPLITAHAEFEFESVTNDIM